MPFSYFIFYLWMDADNAWDLDRERFCLSQGILPDPWEGCIFFSRILKRPYSHSYPVMVNGME